jgi:hypothetical protein
MRDSGFVSATVSGMSIALSDLDWDDVVRNPDEYVEVFVAREAELRTELYEAVKVRRYLEGLRDRKDELSMWKARGIPRPQERRQRRLRAADQVQTAQQGDRKQVGESRRLRVVQLLAQEPARVWKVKEIATALGIANVHSLRASLDEYARNDEMLTKTARAEYRLGPRAEEYMAKIAS